VSVVVTLAFPQYVEPDEIPGHLDDAYQFAYAVASPEHGDYHGHQQSRDENGFTSGSYYLLGADGQWSQTIFADKGAGYQALYNQRPAGAPPPQVSEVSYQIFVHPGATAISAQGGVPQPPPAPAPLVRFNRDILYSASDNPVVDPKRNRRVIVAKVSPDNTQKSGRRQARQNIKTSPSTISEIVVESPDNLQRSARSQNIPDMQTSPSMISEIVVESPDNLQRSSRILAIPDMQTSPSTNSKMVVVPVRASDLPQRRPKSLFTQDVSSLLRRFQPRPVIPRN